MGREPRFADLAEVHPDIHASLQKLLDYPGPVEDLALVFQVRSALLCRPLVLRPLRLQGD